MNNHPGRRCLMFGISLLIFSFFSGLASAAAGDAPAPHSYTIAVRLQSAADDLEEWLSTGVADAGSTDLEIGVEEPGAADVKPQIVGLRFQNIPILPGAVIESAYIQFTVDRVKFPADPFDVRIAAVAGADAVPFDGGKPQALSALPQTEEAVRWVADADNRYAWNEERKAGKAQRTPDLAPLLQAAVNADGWAYGNAVAFVFSGTGNRTATAFERDPDRAAVLNVTFTVTDAQQPAPEGLAGIAPNTLFASNGRLEGTSAQMEFRPAGDGSAKWARCGDGFVEGLASGDYEVRFAEKIGYLAGAAATVHVPLYAGDVILQPGANETEMNFTWFVSGSHADVCLLQIAPAAQMEDGRFPEAAAQTYTGTPKKVEGGLRSNKLTALGLLPDTAYVYRMGNGENWSDVFRFRTRDAENYTAILVGDPQIGASGRILPDLTGWQNTLTLAQATYPDAGFILSAGDHVQSLSSEQQYEAFFSPPQLRSLPLVATVGNHDDGGTYASHYFMPNESRLGGTVSGYDYWFTYGKTLFMVLNTNNRNVSEHEQFMGQAINAAGTDIVWKVVMFHHSIYCSASHSLEGATLTLRKWLYPLMDAYGIDLVLSGHDHCYTRTYQMLGDVAQNGLESFAVNPPGTLYITASSASGSMFYTLKDADKGYRAVRWPTHKPSYSGITVSAAALTVTTYETETNTVIDQYTIIKNEAVPAFLTGIASTAAGAADGRIEGTTADMEYRRTGAAAWTPCGEPWTGGLLPGTYAVRYRASEAKPAGGAATVNVPGALPTAETADIPN